MILFLHNRYRVAGGEERAVDAFRHLVVDELGEDAALLARDSATLGRTRAAAALLGGGLAPDDVAAAVRRTRARVVHAHNLTPAFGPRALAAAREAGARVVLHLHNYRLVCAVGTCFTRGEDCTRCHGRATAPGVALGCRGSRAEALVYAGGLAAWQRRIVALADAIIVPSAFAHRRLLELGAPLAGTRVEVLPPPVALAPAIQGSPSTKGTAAVDSVDGDATAPADRPPFALVASRLAPEKGVDVALEAARRAGIPLVIAGDGPLAPDLRAAAGPGVRFTGVLDAPALAALRAGAALAVVPSRSAETFGLAAAEAMAAGLPVVASRVGALPELLEADALVAPGDVDALAAAMRARAGDRAAGERNRARVARDLAPPVVAGRLAAVYEQVSPPRDP